MIKEFKFGLLGHNVAYSRSMDIFEVIFKLLDIDGSCRIYDFPPDKFNDEFKNIQKNGVNGMSVTIPYKKEIIQHLDEVAPVAQALKAVNSVLFNEGRLTGFNTDCYGFSLPLREHNGRLKHGSALIFGAGGAAKAALYSLYTDYEVKTFFIIGRDISKLERFKASLLEQLKKVEINILTESDYKNIGRNTFDLIVNCTPLGGWNKPTESPMPENFDWTSSKIYYDLNYNENNSAIIEASNNSLEVIDGSTMLVGQALRSFDLWTDITVDFDDVYSQVFKR